MKDNAAGNTKSNANFTAIQVRRKKESTATELNRYIVSGARIPIDIPFFANRFERFNHRFAEIQKTLKSLPGKSCKVYGIYINNG